MLPIVEYSHVDLYRKELDVLTDVTFRVDAGELV